MPDLRFAKPAPPADQPKVDRSTGATIYPHATKEQMIARAEAFLAGGCHVNFIGIPRAEVIELLRSTHDFIVNNSPSVAEDCEAATDAAFALERLLKSMGAWQD